jgi:hypothetical protein
MIMGVRILEGDGMAVLYCSTSMWAFGPIFEDGDQPQEFLEWLGKNDPRLWSRTRSRAARGALKLR